MRSIQTVRPRRASFLTASVLLSLVALLCFGVAPAQAASGNNPHCDGPQCWWVVKANDEPGGVTGVWGALTVERPVVQHGELAWHSLAAMHIVTLDSEGHPYDGVEVGWAVAPIHYGDEEPHLFAFLDVNGHQDGDCWTNGDPPDKCGWVPAPGATHHLGEYIQPEYGSGIGRPFGIRYVSGNWQVSFDQQVIGWFVGSAWNNTFTSGTRVSWYGEVETVNGRSPFCTQMGNGKYGTEAGSAKIGSMGFWTSSGEFRWSHPHVDPITGNANFYNMGDQLNASWMSYGGPGGYTDEYGVDHACV